MTLCYIVFLMLIALSSAKTYCKPSQKCWPTAAEITRFKDELKATSARAITPDEKDFPGKYLTFNQAFAKLPALAVFVGNVDQIRTALRFAFKYNIQVSIVSSGHSFNGNCGADDSMQISVHYMKNITVDTKCPENAGGFGCATVQSGVQWGEIYREANKFNRIVLGGSNPTVSVSGWTLGGGHSPLSRKFGLGVQNVLQFHLVTADLSEVWTNSTGTLVKKMDGRVEFTNDTSLFYALRGGGSAFGVLIDMKIKLHRGSPIAQYACSYPAFTDGTSRSVEIMLNSLGEFLHNAPDTFGGYILPAVLCESKTKQCGSSLVVSMVHYGARENSPHDSWFKKLEGLKSEWKLKGLTNGGCELNKFSTFYDYEMTVPNVTYTSMYIGGSLVQKQHLDEKVVNTITKYLTKAYEAKETIQMTAIFLGGAVNKLADDETPLHKGWKNAVFSLSASTILDPENNPNLLPSIRRVQDFHKEMERFSDGKYYNEAEPDMLPEQWKKEFWGLDKYSKLMGIKKVWDPQNKFTCSQCLGSDWDPATGDVVG